MKAMLNIGGEFVEGVFTEIAAAVNSILEAGNTHRMDQETIQIALGILPAITKVEHVSVTGCTLTSRPSDDAKDTAISVE